jgi:acetyl-CoA carboxylase biotin carboxyl carrier protein
MTDYKEILDHTLRSVPDATRIRIKVGYCEFELDIERAGMWLSQAPEGAINGFSNPPDLSKTKVIIETPGSKTVETIPNGAGGAKIVKAELVGVFYTSPSPDAPSFVNVGQTVKKGDVICIIEAMKMMNEIECPYDGTLTVMLAENGSMVEYGQPLFEIRP